MFGYLHKLGAVPDGHLDFVAANQNFDKRINQPATLVSNITSILRQCGARFDKNAEYVFPFDRTEPVQTTCSTSSTAQGGGGSFGIGNL